MATRKKPLARQPLTIAELRSKAVFRAMNKLMEEGAKDEAHLWSTARIMSSEEFEQVVEERHLAHSCGNPLCTSDHTNGISSSNGSRKKLDALVSGDMKQPEAGERFCSVACLNAAISFAQRLGTTSQAASRFEALMAQLEEAKKAKQQPAASSSNTSETNNNKQPYAAGSKKKPIMLSEIQERTATKPPSAPSIAEDEAMKKQQQQLKGGLAVEGYIPKARSEFNQQHSTGTSSSGRKVRFDEEQNRVRIVGEDQDVAAVQPISTSEQPSSSSTTTTTTTTTTSPQVVVFELEDPQGPLEGNSHNLAAQFGRLRVANASELVGATDASTLLQQTQATVAAATLPISSNTDQDAASVEVDEVVVQRLQQGVKKLFPNLAASLPPEMLEALEAESDTETEASEDWQFSGDEDDDSLDGDYLDGSKHFGSNGDGSSSSTMSGFRMQLSFFGELFSHVEAWVTGTTIDYLQQPEGSTVAPPTRSGSTNPEMLNAMSRFIAIALPSVIDSLGITSVAKIELESALGELLYTMRLIGPLPAFKASQWQVLVIILLKALSFERVVGLRDVYESHEGRRRMNQTLGELKFTIEEFYCVLELLCPPEE